MLRVLGNPQRGIASRAQVAVDEGGLDFVSTREVVVHVVDQGWAGTTQDGAGGDRCEETQGDTGTRHGDADSWRLHDSLHSVIGGEGSDDRWRREGLSYSSKSNELVDPLPDFGAHDPGDVARGNDPPASGVGCPRDPPEPGCCMSENVAGERATLGGGCFWCLEAVFERVDGVLGVRSGYSGGAAPNPTYREVCSGTSGHAEVVEVLFDPTAIAYREILEIFFAMHDPTTLNRQGADVGTQYRSVIFHHSDGQRAVAENVMRELQSQGLWDDPIVTELAPLGAFYAAEEYHQEYFRNNPQQPYCQVVVAPKVSKLRQRFAHRLREDV